MYNAIASNKRKTWVLVTLFSILTMAIVVLFGMQAGLDVYSSLAVGFGISVVYSLFSFYRADKVALFTHGAKEITKEQAPEVWRIVENLTIASGMPMPKIYIINDEAPNAFATGRDPEHASVAFTTGLLSILDKNELEAVAAHELSHIKNFDIRLMTITVVLIGLVVLLSDIMVRFALHGRGNSRNTPWPVIIVAIALAILSPIIAQIIKLAISRTREYLADSSGALMTRHPDALASALGKLRDSGKVMKRANHATAHLFISSPFGEKTKKSAGWYQRIFATHPPIDERIARLTKMGR